VIDKIQFNVRKNSTKAKYHIDEIIITKCGQLYTVRYGFTPATTLHIRKVDKRSQRTFKNTQIGDHAVMCIA
jgi:hypothetical protein